MIKNDVIPKDETLLLREKFINEYYNFYELCETNKFGIPIKLLVKYLGIARQDKIN